MDVSSAYVQWSIVRSSKKSTHHPYATDINSTEYLREGQQKNSPFQKFIPTYKQIGIREQNLEPRGIVSIDENMRRANRRIILKFSQTESYSTLQLN